MASIKDTWLDWYKDRRIEENVALLANRLHEAGVRRVLDFGTGTGRHTVFLARMGFEVYGFDWSDKAITITKQELSREGLSANLTVWDMNDTPLPYDNDFFDGVIAVRVLHHTYVEKILRIAAEIERVTRKGGYFYVEVPAWAKGEKVRNQGVIEVEPGTLLWSSGQEANIPHHHFRRNEMLKVFEDFAPLTFEEKDGHYCFTGIKK